MLKSLEKYVGSRITFLNKMVFRKQIGSGTPHSAKWRTSIYETANPSIVSFPSVLSWFSISPLSSRWEQQPEKRGALELNLSVSTLNDWLLFYFGLFHHFELCRYLESRLPSSVMAVPVIVRVVSPGVVVSWPPSRWRSSINSTIML